MKSTMPFYGIPMPVLRKTCREVFAAHPLGDAAAWRTAAEQLWHRATRRESRHAAIELLAWPRYQKRFLDLDALPLLRHMIVTGAWWDYVDALAINHVGPLLRDHRNVMTPTLLEWSRDDDLWIRRSAILAQLKHRADTDLDLLFFAIEGSIADNDFFARKAIGWALRELSKTLPDVVTSYVAENEVRLSGLTKREALKALKAQSKRVATPT